MQTWDYIKAIALAAAVLLLNLLTLVGLVVGYSYLIAPGQSPEAYAQAAPRIGQWSGPIAGALIMFALVWGVSRRKPRRPALAFAAAVVASYIVIDVAAGLAVSPASDLLRLPFFLGMIGVASAAFAAARLSRDSFKASD